MPRTKKLDPQESIPEEQGTQVPVKLVSYTISATISVGKNSFSNVTPTIVVQAPTLNEARDYVIPHIQELYETFFNISDKQAEIKREQREQKYQEKLEVQKKKEEEHKDKAQEVEQKLQNVREFPVSAEQIAAEAFAKASNAIYSCGSLEALGLIEKKIQDSVKISDADKKRLAPILIERALELSPPVEEIPSIPEADAHE